jgi:hypothetical protein
MNAKVSKTNKDQKNSMSKKEILKDLVISWAAGKISSGAAMGVVYFLTMPKTKLTEAQKLHGRSLEPLAEKALFPDSFDSKAWNWKTTKK